MEKVKIYDTTLRDGMQSEGVSFSLQDKLLIAQKLDDIGIDYIEGGYAVSNPKEMQFFKEIAGAKLKHAKVVGFGNTRRRGVTAEEDGSLCAILESGAPAAALVGKTWDMHATEVLRVSLDENIDMVAESVAYMKKKGREVIFDAEHFYDGYKNNAEYALKVLSAAANAGADVLALCDTNGGCLPEEIFEITSAVRKHIGSIQLGIHVHNDSDNATANSLAAVRAGARQVQGTINGLGERCGNANLCTIIPNLTLKMGFETIGSDKIKMLTELSRFICEMANLTPSINMPYVGLSAFAHKAGLHVDALRKNRKTYEHIAPETVGNARRFLISELSGASNVLAKLEGTKIAENKELAKKLLAQVQDLENEGYQFEAADASFDLLVRKAVDTYKPAFEFVNYRVNVERNSEGRMVIEATVKLMVDGVTEHVVAEGDGPVNALDKALRKALDRFYPDIRDMHLIDYKVRVVNAKDGTAARVRVVIESRDKEAVWGTVGVSENVIDASWKALVDSVDYKILKDADKKCTP
jgi:2-isopropylmalate synthase